MTSKRLTVGAMLAALLSACSAPPKGEPFTALAAPIAGSALLYVYRLEHDYAKGKAHPILIDGQRVGDVAENGHLLLRVRPGRHVISSKTSKSDVPLTVELNGGTVSYYRLAVDSFDPFGRFRRVSLAPVSRETAARELARTRAEPENHKPGAAPQAAD